MDFRMKTHLVYGSMQIWKSMMPLILYNKWQLLLGLYLVLVTLHGQFKLE